MKKLYQFSRKILDLQLEQMYYYIILYFIVLYLNFDKI